LKKYWSRLALGILLGVMFGLFNASFVWGTRVIFERMEPAKPKVENATENSSVSKGKGILQKLDAVVDACLPRRGEPMNWQQALGGLLFLPLLVGLRGSMNFSSGYCMVWASSYAIRDLKLDTHSKLQSLSMDYFQKKEIGQHTMLLNRGIESLQRCLDHGFSDAVKEPFAVLAIAISLFILDWQLALFGLVFVPLTLFPIIFLGRRVRKIAKAAYAQGTDQDSLLVQVYTNMRTIKAFCLEKVQLDRFGKMYQRLARLGIKQNQARLILNPTVEVLGIVGLGAVIVFVFYSGKSAPDLVAFLTGSMLMYQPIKKLGNLNATVQEAMAGVERIEEVQRAEATVAEGDDSKPLAPLAEMIRIENVTFSYGDEAVLRNVSVDLPKGTKLGVAGESGAGKSTLVSLMLRFYDPGEGRITIDGVDIREASFASLRGQIALVSQEVVIFDQTVSDNIACGKLDATPEEIAVAARAANADAFIENLPEGYATRLGEEGTRLSGGQRQRIALARAFVRQAPILILDEATASLDSKAEAEVQGAIDHLEEGRTVICVAHRLSTLRGMDQIIVLDAGRIVEQGSFSELLARDGPFAAMARKQGISSEAVRS
jgi:ABC-type multidrug transport system fused ATPase/permease subunit